jgi:hypothetical protein
MKSKNKDNGNLCGDWEIARFITFASKQNEKVFVVLWK